MSTSNVKLQRRNSWKCRWKKKWSMLMKKKMKNEIETKCSFQNNEIQRQKSFVFSNVFLFFHDAFELNKIVVNDLNTSKKTRTNKSFSQSFWNEWKQKNNFSRVIHCISHCDQCRFIVDHMLSRMMKFVRFSLDFHISITFFELIYQCVRSFASTRFSRTFAYIYFCFSRSFLLFAVSSLNMSVWRLSCIFIFRSFLHFSSTLHCSFYSSSVNFWRFRENLVEIDETHRRARKTIFVSISWLIKLIFQWIFVSIFMISSWRNTITSQILSRCVSKS